MADCNLPFSPNEARHGEIRIIPPCVDAFENLLVIISAFLVLGLYMIEPCVSRIKPFDELTSSEILLKWKADGWRFLRALT